MQMKQFLDLHNGDIVRWHDPDDGLCSKDVIVRCITTPDDDSENDPTLQVELETDTEDMLFAEIGELELLFKEDDSPGYIEKWHTRGDCEDFIRTGLKQFGAQFNVENKCKFYEIYGHDVPLMRSPEQLDRSLAIVKRQYGAEKIQEVTRKLAATVLGPGVWKRSFHPRKESLNVTRDYEIVVRIICENDTCKKNGKLVNQVNGFGNAGEANDFVEQFSESNDPETDCCKCCGELGVAQDPQAVFLLVEKGAGKFKPLIVQISDVDAPEESYQLKISGPCLVPDCFDGLARLWHAALNATKELRPEDWQLFDVKAQLVAWGYKVGHVKSPDVRVTY